MSDGSCASGSELSMGVRMEPHKETWDHVVLKCPRKSCDNTHTAKKPAFVRYCTRHHENIDYFGQVADNEIIGTSDTGGDRA